MFRPTLTIVVIERRKPCDWEPPRPPPVISPQIQKQIDQLSAAVKANKDALNRILKK